VIWDGTPSTPARTLSHPSGPRTHTHTDRHTHTAAAPRLTGVPRDASRYSNSLGEGVEACRVLSSSPSSEEESPLVLVLRLVSPHDRRRWNERTIFDDEGRRRGRVGGSVLCGTDCL